MIDDKWNAFFEEGKKEGLSFKEAVEYAENKYVDYLENLVDDAKLRKEIEDVY